MLSSPRLWAASLALSVLAGCGGNEQDENEEVQIPPRSEPVAGPTPEPPPARPSLKELEAAETAAAARYQESELLDDRWQWIGALAGLGWGLADQGREKEAVAPYRTAFSLLPDGAELEDALFVAQLHDGFGRALQSAGEFEDAEHHLSLALHYRAEGSWAGANVQRGTSEAHLGLLLLVQGRYSEALGLFRSALARTPVDDHGLLAHRHDCFGRYYLALRAHKLATEHFEKAVTHAAVDVAEDDALILDLRTNLALCLLRTGDAHGALLECNALRELDADHPTSPLRRAELLNLSGTIKAALRQFETADSELTQAAQIIAREKGESHPAYPPYLANLGALRVQAGDHQAALPMLLQARTLLQENVEAHHQTLVQVLYQIAACQLHLAPDKAQSDVLAARKAAGDLLSVLLANGSERELLTFRHQVDLHSVVCNLGDPKLIADSLLNAKGEIMAAVLERRSRDHARSRRRSTMQRELDQLLLEGSNDNEIRIAALRRELGELVRSEQPRDSPRLALGWTQIQESLPAGSVFIDCVRYQPLSSSEARYGAVVHFPKRDPQWVLLGTEGAMRWQTLLSRALSARAEILRTGKGESFMLMSGLLRKLYQAYWEPLAEILPDDLDQVILSPAGKMHLLPYAVLRNKEGRFLCEEIPLLRLVDSARNLPRTATPVSNQSPWLVAGVGDFSAHRKRAKESGARHSAPWSKALQGLHDLTNIRAEVSSLRKLAPPGSTILLDHQAQEAVLRDLKFAPGILHLASHGVHVPLGGGGDLLADPSALYENGILLAPGGQDDGILFPEEAAALNLKGTRLVTLSTCRSALGRPVFGEGILGLRRGFAMAGAHNILASLWEVPDESTAELMSRYYEGLSHGRDPAALLWQEQAGQFGKLSAEDPSSAVVENAILSFGGFVLTSSASGGL